MTHAESRRADMGTAPASGFAAFISYSQRDVRIARRLHLALKRYRVPTGLDVPGLTEDRTIGRVFRDDEDMGADPSLARALDALVDSASSLIVVCTPNSARSTWVDKEIRRFKRRDAPRVFAVIAAGTPHAASHEEECFAPSLKMKIGPDGLPTGDPDEPLAPNLRNERLPKVTARLVAGILGIHFDELWRHDRRRARRRRGAISALVAFGLGGGILAALETVRLFDSSGLVTASAQVSAEAWRRASDDEVFEQAFRTALAATTPPGALIGTDTRLQECNLNAAITSATCALAFSGRALRSRRVFDERPTTPRGNFRDDIPGASGVRRRALQLSSHVRRLAFTPSGAYLALAHTDGRIVVHDLRAAKTVADLQVAGMDQGPIAMDEGGRDALVKGRDGNLVEVDVRTGVSHLIAADASSVHQLARSASGWIALVSGSSGTRLLEIENGAIVRQLGIEEFMPYHGRSFGRNGRLASYAQDALDLVDVASGRSDRIEVDRLGDGIGQVKSIAADDRLEWVAIGGNGSGGTDNAVQVISVAKRKAVMRLAGHSGEVYAIAFSPDGSLIASGGADMTVRLWRRESGTEVVRLGGHASDITDLAFAPDGRTLVTAASDGVVILWDTSPILDDTQSLRTRICLEREGLWRWPSTMLSAEEGTSLSYLSGRPGDVCGWRGPGWPSGVLQSTRAALSRSVS